MAGLIPGFSSILLYWNLGFSLYGRNGPRIFLHMVGLVLDFPPYGKTGSLIFLHIYYFSNISTLPHSTTFLAKHLFLVLFLDSLPGAKKFLPPPSPPPPNHPRAMVQWFSSCEIVAPQPSATSSSSSDYFLCILD